MNYHRARLGLAAMARQPQLNQAAAAHANYLALNGYAEGHDETLGHPGYTGSDIKTRIAAAGYGGVGYSENIASTPAGIAGNTSTDMLIDAPFHRSAQLSTFTQAGAATKTSTFPHDLAANIYVIDFGQTDTSSRWANLLWGYPSSGQTDSWLDWIVNESPNPAPDLNGQRVGYPITLHAANGSVLAPSGFSLTDSTGAVVAVRAVTSMPPKSSMSLKDLGGYALWIPLTPFTPGMTYTASASGKLNGKDFQVKWNFTTLAATPLQVNTSGPSFTGPGSALTFTLTGGSHRFSLKTYHWDYPNAMNQYPTVSVRRSGIDEWTATRDTIACPTTTTACGELSVTFIDTAGNEVVKTVPIL